jgi:mono/diheme cytochrome c family protein
MRHIVTALFVVAFATAAYADGAATYAAKCKMCHGAAGEGTKLAPDPIKGKAADVTKKAVTDGTKGKVKMKPIKLEAADLDAVAAHVAGLK